MSGLVTQPVTWSRNISVTSMVEDQAISSVGLLHSSSKLSTSDIVMLLILILATSGNCLLIAVLIRVRRLKKNIDKFILNLSVCDLSLVLVSIPPQLAAINSSYPLGLFGCKVIDPLGTMAVNSAVFTLVAIARERLQVIRQPITFTAVKKRIWPAIVAIHVSSLLLVVPYMGTKTYAVSAEGEKICQEQWSLTARRIYTIVLALFQYFIPVPLMVVSYSFAWRSVQVMNNRFISETMIVRKKKTRLMNNSSRCQVKTLESECVILDVRKGACLTEISTSSGKNVTESANSASQDNLSSPTDEVGISAAPRVDTCVQLQLSQQAPSSPCPRSKQSVGAVEQTAWSLRGRRSKNMEPNKPNDNSRTSLGLNRNRMICHRRAQTRSLLEMFSVVVFIFILFMLPSQILWIVIDFQNSGVHPGMYGTAASIANTFTYANSVLNPIIYGGLNKKFREDFKQLFWTETKRKRAMARKLKERTLTAHA